MPMSLGQISLRPKSIHKWAIECLWLSESPIILFCHDSTFSADLWLHSQELTDIWPIYTPYTVQTQQPFLHTGI